MCTSGRALTLEETINELDEAKLKRDAKAKKGVKARKDALERFLMMTAIEIKYSFQLLPEILF